MRFYFDNRSDSVVLLPTLSVTLGRCDCCDRVGGVLITLDFLLWSVGISVKLPNPPH